MTLHLTDPQHAVLLEIIESAHREKLHELHHTDSVAYRSLLRQRIAVLEQLHQQLAVESVV